MTAIIILLWLIFGLFVWIIAGPILSILSLFWLAVALVFCVITLSSNNLSLDEIYSEYRSAILAGDEMRISYWIKQIEQHGGQIPVSNVVPKDWHR